MGVQRYCAVLCAVVVFVAPAGSAHAALLDRGNGMVYDSQRGITWLKDANYAKTSGYDSDGLMNLGSAKLFADGLIYAGFDDWVLPQVYPSNYEFTLETLLEVSLGNPWSGYGHTPLPNPGPFVNFETQVGYWHRGAAHWSHQTWYYIYDAYSHQQENGHYSGDARGVHRLADAVRRRRRADAGELQHGAAGRGLRQLHRVDRDRRGQG